MNPQMKPHNELESLYGAMRQDAEGQPALNNGATIFGAYLVALAVTGVASFLVIFAVKLGF